MFGLFKRNSHAGDGEPSLDAIRFDETGYALQGEPQPGKVRVWHTPKGDGLGVYFFQVSPDLPSNAASIDQLVEHYRKMLGDSGGRLVDVAVVTAGGCRALRTILSVPQEPSGRTYVGSLTVPFRDFSFVIKCQCAEGGPTGLKEAALLSRKLATKSVQFDEERFQIPDWNPDDEKYDAEFPDHPVARVRQVLAHVADSLVIENRVRELPGFPLPQ